MFAIQKYNIVSGSKYGMADFHLYPFLERFPAISQFGVDVLPADKFPRLTAWMSAMQQQDCVKKCWISTKLHHHYLVGYKAGNPHYDVELDDETVAMQNSVA